MSSVLYSNTSSSSQNDRISPKGRRPFRVIGAGLSRTGTLSFTVALEKLLMGPVCHGGTVILAREECMFYLRRELIAGLLAGHITDFLPSSVDGNMDLNSGP